MVACSVGVAENSVESGLVKYCTLKGAVPWEVSTGIPSNLPVLKKGHNFVVVGDLIHINRLQIARGNHQGQAEIFPIKNVVLAGLSNGNLVIFFRTQRPHFNVETPDLPWPYRESHLI